VHVRNLSSRTDEKKLQEKLEKYGNISKIEIIRERATGYIINYQLLGSLKDTDLYIFIKLLKHRV